MKLVSIFLLAIFVGCAHSRVDLIKDEFLSTQVEIKEIVLGIYKNIENKKLDGLESQHLFGPKFSKFDLVGVARRLNAEETRKIEHDMFSSFSKAKYDVIDLKVDVFKKVSIASYILGYNVDMGGKNYTGKARGTLVFVKDGETWKITHEHFSPYF